MLDPRDSRQWLRCPKSASLVAQYAPVRQVTDAMTEGAEAHRIAMLAVRGQALPADADSTMVQGAKMLLADYEAHTSPTPGQGVSTFIDKHSDSFSKLIGPSHHDIRMVDYNAKRYVLWVYHFGHRFRDAAEDLPGLIAICSIEFQNLGDQSSEWLYELRIVQPRAYEAGVYVSSKVWNRPELRARRAELDLGAKATLAEEGSCNTGEHCRECRVRASCSALGVATGISVDVSRRTRVDQQTAAQLADELSLLNAAKDRISARLSGLEEEAKALISKGVAVPGWGMKGRTSIRWSVDPSIAIQAASIEGINIAKPQDVMTPNQALDAGMSSVMVAALSKSVPGKLSLKPVTEKDVSKAFPKIS